MTAPLTHRGITSHGKISPLWHLRKCGWKFFLGSRLFLKPQKQRLTFALHTRSTEKTKKPFRKPKESASNFLPIQRQKLSLCCADSKVAATDSFCKAAVLNVLGAFAVCS